MAEPALKGCFWSAPSFIFLFCTVLRCLEQKQFLVWMYCSPSVRLTPRVVWFVRLEEVFIVLLPLLYYCPVACAATSNSFCTAAMHLLNSTHETSLQERPCNATCRRVELCAAWASRSKAHQKCMLLGAQGLASSQPRTVVEATTSIRDLLTGFSVSGLILVSIVLVVRAKRARMMVGPRYGRFS